MIRALRAFRLSTLQLAAVTSVSLAATVLIVVNATGSTPLGQAVVAALARRVVVHHVAPAPVASDPVSNSGGSGGGGGSNGGGGGGSGSNNSSGGSNSSSGSGGSTGSGGGTTTTSTTTTTTTPTPTPKSYPVKHVFVIALSTPSYEAAFGAGSVARYLNGTLRKRGTVLSGFHTLVDSSELADELAMVSGQAPNADTRAGCTTYSEFSAKAKPAKNGQVPGDGCIYPNTTLTIGDQVTSSGAQWGAYIDDMGKVACVHPNSGAADDVALPGAGPEYDTRHNPFIYFHSLLDLGDCASDDLALDQLPAALSKSSKTPEYTFIAPGSCDDAAGGSCPAGTAGGTTGGTTGGIVGEDDFLKTWVPKILDSAAYKKNGALVVAFTTPAGTTPKAKPVKTGALVISQYTTAGHTVSTAYGPYSLLRTIEDIFGFTPLAHAKAASSFADLFTKGT